MKEKEKPGVILYWETFETAEDAEPAEKAELWDAVYQYSRYGVIPEFTSKLTSAVWKLTKHRIDNDIEKYASKVERSRESAWIKEYKTHFALVNGLDPEDAAELEIFLNMKRAGLEPQTNASERMQAQTNAENNMINASERTQTKAKTRTETKAKTRTETETETKAETENKGYEGYIGRREHPEDVRPQGKHNNYSSFSEADRLMNLCNAQAMQQNGAQP